MRLYKCILLLALIPSIIIGAGCDWVVEWIFLPDTYYDITVINCTTNKIEVNYPIVPYDYDEYDYEERTDSIYLFPGESADILVRRDYIDVIWRNIRRTYNIEDDCTIDVQEEDFIVEPP